MKADHDSPEQKAARAASSAEGTRRHWTFDEIWDEIQAKNRAAGPWGALAMWREREEA